MRIVGVQGMSMIDFPGNIAAVLFTCGCDFRCPYCQNPDLLSTGTDIPDMAEAALWDFLEERKGFIDGVVITGGEPLIHADLPDFCLRLRERTGLAMKVDTNGNHPDGLRRLIDAGATDYIAMDIKTDLPRYSEAAGKLVDIDRVTRSIALLMERAAPFEFRTTVVPGLVDEAAVDSIGRLIRGAPLWAFQQFQNRSTLDPALRDLHPLSPEKVRALALRAESFVERVVVRGV